MAADPRELDAAIKLCKANGYVVIHRSAWEFTRGPLCEVCGSHHGPGERHRWLHDSPFAALAAVRSTPRDQETADA